MNASKSKRRFRMVMSATPKLAQPIAYYSCLVAKGLPMSGDYRPIHRSSRIGNKRPSRAGIRPNAGITNGKLTFQAETLRDPIINGKSMVGRGYRSRNRYY